MSGKKTNYLTPKEQLERDRLDNDLFQILEDHLNGIARGILRARLEALCNDEKLGGKDALTLYREAHISAGNAKKLLNMLCVSKQVHEPDTLFDWIKYLSQNNYGHRHLEDFYHLLQEVKPRKSWAVPLFFITLGTALTSIYLYFSPQKLRALERLVAKLVPMITRFLQTTFSVLKNIPLLLFIYNVLCIPTQAFHSIFRDTFRSFPKRLQRWITGTLPAVLCLISYALAYAAQGVFTPLAVGFFITSSFISVFNSLFNFRQLKPIGDEPLKSAPLEIRLDYIRQKERRTRTAQTIGVNLVASIFISISVILWGILPPTLFIMLGCIMFINLVNFTKEAILNRIHTKGAEALQKALYEVSRGNEMLSSCLAPQQSVEALETITTNGFAKVLEKLEEIKAESQVQALRQERQNERICHLETIQRQMASNQTWGGYIGSFFGSPRSEAVSSPPSSNIIEPEQVTPG